MPPPGYAPPSITRWTKVISCFSEIGNKLIYTKFGSDVPLNINFQQVYVSISEFICNTATPAKPFDNVEVLLYIIPLLLENLITNTPVTLRS